MGARPFFIMKQVRWDLTLATVPEVNAEPLAMDCIECQLLDLTLHSEDLVVGFVRYRLLLVKESLQWLTVLQHTIDPWTPSML